MSAWSLTDQQSVFKRCHSNKHILPTRWRRKPAGVDMELNYATVSLRMSKSTTDIHVWLQAFLTPLLLAARFSSAELVRRLLLAGADIDNCTRVLEIDLCLHISHSITCYKTAAAIFMNVEVHMCALRLSVCVRFIREMETFGFLASEYFEYATVLHQKLQKPHRFFHHLSLVNWVS